MKKCFSMLLGLLFLAGISVDGLQAQTAPKSIDAGVVNGKAVRLTPPVYPQGLRDAGIEGIALVNVVIDEAGSVIFAEAEVTDQRMRKTEDGTVLEPAVLDSQLRTAAETAARDAKFAPTLIAGVATQIRGRIFYNFDSKTRKIEGDVTGSIIHDPTSGNIKGQMVVVSRGDQPTSVSAPRMGNGGILNGKAVSLPKPEYPAAAKAVKAGGTVSVQVMVDEEGNVISAEAVSGHPLLRSASETAARGAKFSPTLLSGQLVKISGVLTYNFVP